MYLNNYFAGWMKKIYIAVILPDSVNRYFNTFRCSASILLSVDFAQWLGFCGFFCFVFFGGGGGVLFFLFVCFFNA